MMISATLFLLFAVSLLSSHGFVPRVSLWRHATVLKHNILPTADHVAIHTVDHNHVRGLGKYRVSGHIPSNELDEYIRDYKDELKRRRVIIPGFRPGVVPPHAMQEVRHFAVDHALTKLLGTLCSVNELKVCNDTRQETDISDASTLTSMVQADEHGKNYLEQREAWREGVNFPFVIEFLASHKGRKSDVTVVAKTTSSNVEAIDIIETEEVQENTIVDT